MTPFVELQAAAIGLSRDSVDTDQLIPARFMKEPRSVGYGQFLLHDLRFDSKGQPVSDFVLNQSDADQCRVLVAGRNFGAGSSREAAVYALADYGFRCVIAPSFGDIFASNAVNNGVLPALISQADCTRLLKWLGQTPKLMTVNLHSQTLTTDLGLLSFDINAAWKTRLLKGWDEIDLTRQHEQEIADFHARYQEDYPWMSVR